MCFMCLQLPASVPGWEPEQCHCPFSLSVTVKRFLLPMTFQLLSRPLISDPLGTSHLRS